MAAMVPASPTRAALTAAIARMEGENRAAGLTAALRQRIISLLRKFG
jgi:hypothetical protein